MNNAAMTVLLVEDDPLVLLGAEQALTLAGITVLTATDAETAFQLMSTAPPDTVVSDIRLPGADGFELLRRVREWDSEVPVILMTGHGDIRMAVDAMHNGAYDFLEKPFSSDRLTEVVRRALEKRHLVVENRRLQALVAAQSVSDLIGQAPTIKEAKRRINALGPTQVDILIRGETGTGKEVVARALHKASGRRGPFVAINCGALPESIFESEMFGHEVGAFTGAARKRVGKLEYARGGTVFLDEIESLPLSQQVKMLRVLQERRLERLGGNESVAIDCRFIAAAKEDLKILSEQGSFRADLFYRLNVAHITLPPIRERREDIPLLMAHCIRLAADRYEVTPPTWTELQMARWQGHDWPGNVRELKNVADRLCLGLEGDAGFTDTHPTDSPALSLQIEAFEKHLILQALITQGGNVTLAADHLKLPRKTLYDKVARHAIDPSLYRSPA